MSTILEKYGTSERELQEADKEADVNSDDGPPPPVQRGRREPYTYEEDKKVGTKGGLFFFSLR